MRSLLGLAKSFAERDDDFIKHFSRSKKDSPSGFVSLSRVRQEVEVHVVRHRSDGVPETLLICLHFLSERSPAWRELLEMLAIDSSNTSRDTRVLLTD